MRNILDFEKNIADLQDKITKLRESGSSKSSLIEVNEQIEQIKLKIDKKLSEIYKNLTPWHKLQVARHHNRPHFLDYIKILVPDFEPLSGDRLFREDSALICGFGTFNNRSVMIIGNEKGSNTELRIKHNFGMAKPEGFRKALRVMRLAEKFSLPLISLVDTPGAYPGVGAEQRGQSEAIAKCIEVSLSLKIPTISVIIGEGGSGGAIAIATTNKVLMLEHSVYSVISPEGCASILWKNANYAEEAATAMKITAQDLQKLNVIDEIIPEPTGGAHRNSSQTIKNVGAAITKSLNQIIDLNSQNLVDLRRQRYLMIANKSL
ncbi:MAG: Acetyl-coenzyme A carboxylase carboxyl transferase subunit alpha [Alphaproteobacteria bacterium MarineAlpha6_Bin1]|nr:MAG: Acetyl-coenzyme A carboxylase carboxyl transferase subunit alpha [Alphaproteobacteria bacterium MarineAlpha6_Bin1]